MKQNKVAGGTHLNNKRHDFWLPLVRDRRLLAATTASLLQTIKGEEINNFLHYAVGSRNSTITAEKNQ
jgi:hypothetical protein